LKPTLSQPSPQPNLYSRKRTNSAILALIMTWRCTACKQQIRCKHPVDLGSGWLEPFFHPQGFFVRYQHYPGRSTCLESIEGMLGWYWIAWIGSTTRRVSASEMIKSFSSTPAAGCRMIASTCVQKFLMRLLPASFVPSPQLRELNPESLIARRSETCANQVGVQHSELLLWTTLLETSRQEAMITKKDKTSNQASVPDPQLALIQELMRTNQLPVQRLEALETNLNGRGEQKQASAPISNAPASTSLPPAPRKKSSPTQRCRRLRISHQCGLNGLSVNLARGLQMTEISVRRRSSQSRTRNSSWVASL
jgi:hypothetical protein